MALPPQLVDVFTTLGIDPTHIEPDSRLRDDLDMDSAEIIAMVSECEAVYRVSIRDDGDLVASLTDVGTVLALVHRHLAPTSRSASGRPGDAAAPDPDAVAMDTAPGFAHRCTEDAVIAAAPAVVYAALFDVARWPDRLPHVRAIDLHHDDGQYQEFHMSVASEGATMLHVRSIRNCRPGVIEFFQPEPPPYLRHHGGIWRFSETADGATRVEVTHAWNLDDSAAVHFPPQPGHDTAAQVRDVLAGHSRLALDRWKTLLETDSALLGAAAVGS